MIRLIDRILADHDILEPKGAEPAEWDCFKEMLLKRMSGAEVIVIDNIAQYIVSQKESVDESDFPNIAPPFKKFFIEYATPPSVMEKKIEGMPIFTGLYFEVAYDSSDGTSFPDGTPESVTRDNPRWILVVWLSGKMHYGVAIDGLVYYVSVASDGKMMNFAICQQKWNVGAPIPFGAAKAQPLVFGLVGIAFMHCRNVTHEEIAPSAPLARAYRKRHGRPPVTYKVLKIEPMTKRLNELVVNGNGFKKALHICRGHFKDYTQSGLFGRIKGIFWWDSRVQGTDKTRRVVKSYDVAAPNEIFQGTVA